MDAGLWITLAALAGCAVFIFWVFKPRVTLSRLPSQSDEVILYESAGVSLAVVLGKGLEAIPNGPFCE